MAKWEEAPLVEASEGQGSGGWQSAPMAEDQFMIGGDTADMVRSGLSGLISGVPIAGPAMLGGVKRAAAGLSSLVGGPEYEQGLGQVQSGLAGNIAEHPNLNTAGQIAGGIAGGMAVPGGAFATLPRAIASGAAMSGGDIAARTYAETGQLPPAQQVIMGSIFGAALGAGGYKLGQIMQRPKLDPVANQQVDLLTTEGVNITAGQASGARELLKREASAPNAMDFVDAQKKAFSRAVLRRVGIDLPDGTLTEGILDDAFRANGQHLDALAARNIIPPNTIGTQILQQMRTTVDDAASNYNRLRTSKAAGIVKETQAKVARYLKTGVPGDEYARLRSDLETNARRFIKNDPLLADTLRQMRGALDNAMDLSVAAFNPADSQLWRMARRLHSNLLVVEKAFVRPDAADGLISPKGLMDATKAVKGQKLFARGLTEFGDLARAGVSRMRTLPTVAQGSITDILGRLGANAAAHTAAVTAGYYTMGPMGAAIGAVPAFTNLARSRLALQPMSNLSGQAASTGGKVGSTLGSLASQTGHNPFANLFPQGDQK